VRQAPHALPVPRASRRHTGRVFDATLALERRPITGWSLAATAARYPVMSLKIIAGIYWQALRLWSKRTPVYEHPDSMPPKMYTNL